MVISVSELNKLVKDFFDLNPMLQNLYVKGEISNFKRHSSGHLYFSLKDEASVIKAVMFKYSAYSLEFEPENGMKVIVNARLSSYERDGVYQLYVNEMQPDGVGALHIRFEQLKEKLSKEGLFDEKYKKPLPSFPSCVGVVTSPTGAAVRDIINVIKRRSPSTDILIYPASVQGEDAYKTVVAGIEYLNSEKVDVMIVGRGGGSIEDLWSFNEEAVARAIFKSSVPVVSAVGHETDYTISDFVADLRAPTPSAAAELCVPDTVAVKEFILNSRKTMYNGLMKNLSIFKERVSSFRKSGVLASPARLLEGRVQDVEVLKNRLCTAFSGALSQKKEAFIKNIAKLDSLSPLKVLKRGYTFVEDDSGKVIDSARAVKGDDLLSLRFSDGRVECRVLSKKMQQEV
ncbi:MAG: exodeoxyribonuclease VII large subunit [Ruminococcaceae bacterium]|nr:exodeoxyribonuclease VII large subunit [Oscillospiraceae bacterium]